MISKNKFPMDVSGYKPLSLDLTNPILDDATYKQWTTNIQIVRDVIVFFTAVAGVKGIDGHTGGPYDIVPEALLADGFRRGSDKVYSVLFDEAGHRVALQYAIAAFNGDIPFDLLLEYRVHGHGLYGHAERNHKLGIKFSSGRLGHLWSMVNGVALAYPEQSVVLLGSDGSQMEGDDAEAARFAVAHNLNVKVIIDDNDITCMGRPTEFMPGFDISKTLIGHGLLVDTGEGEDFKSLYTRFQKALTQPGPVALINKRVMAPGLPEIEGTTKAHEKIDAKLAVQLLRSHGHDEAAAYIESLQTPTNSRIYKSSSKEKGSNRHTFGKAVADMIEKIPADERKHRVLAVDTDLARSVGLQTICDRFPECFVQGGIMERNSFSVAAGFGFEEGKIGIFSTYTAFLEMIISEETMARLNDSNVLCHLSHSGVDMLPDNTCHYGINVFFADNGLPGQHPTPLYFPADPLQVTAIVERVFYDSGLRFVFSTRPQVPYILNTKGERFFDKSRYSFESGKDEVIREGSDGYIVAYGDTLYRGLDAVETLRERGYKVGLINKPTLNVVDEEMMAKLGKAPFVLVVETQNERTGLGCRFGTWLLERGYTPKYQHMGVHQPGEGGAFEQVKFQELEPEHIVAKVEKILTSSLAKLRYNEEFSRSLLKHPLATTQLS